ncbi:sensor histidine kinase [Aestuariispira insulae]|nr:ATP-binding protein [Aestuariispira insulae]
MAGRIVAIQSLNDLSVHAEQRTTLYASSLKAALSRFDYLPFVVAEEARILGLMLAPGQEAIQRAANEYLERMNDEAGAAALYVLDAEGTTVAASNWRTPESFVGQNYHFRPYFQIAARGDPGRYFAIGVTTNQPGYFLSYPIRLSDEIVGVAVVKVDLDPLQHDWASGGESIFVADENGVIVLSSQEAWRYHSLRPLPDDLRLTLNKTRQYNQTDPLLMNWRDQGPPSGGLQPVSVQPETNAPLQSTKPPGLYFAHATPLPDFGWSMYFLAPDNVINADVAAARIMTGIIALALVFAGLYWRQRLHTRKLRRLSRAELEARIEERTRELQEAQSSLVQAGKLAALGQMSAAIAHELNQPLAAMRTYAASALMLIGRDAPDQASDTVSKMNGLVDRMAQITGHLKQFARKSPKQLEPTPIGKAVNNALTLLEPELRLREVSVETIIPEGQADILGDTVRLEQVFINLARNALDAMEGVNNKSLTIRLESEDGFHVIEFADNGPGIPAEELDQLFDPFFTTKEVGKGLGLGLSLSYGIIRDFGGSISARNALGGGAVFRIALPVYETKQPHAEVA